MTARALELATQGDVFMPHTPVELDSIRWDGDTATVELTDGSELTLYMLESARGEYRLDFECMSPGLELHTWRTAEPWVDAHEEELREDYDAHCRDERWADDA